MGFFDPKSGDQIDRAIANVRDLGAKASKEDRDTAKTAMNQSGSRGNAAKKAFEGR